MNQKHLTIALLCLSALISSCSISSRSMKSSPDYLLAH